MRFSDAIREGAKLGPQTYEQGHTLPHLRHEGHCALEGAVMALGMSQFDWPLAPSLWPLLTKSLSDCPVCAHGFGRLMSVVWHLNDQHRWTREAIADWYEATFEQPSDESLIAATVQEVKADAVKPELVKA